MIFFVRFTVIFNQTYHLIGVIQKLGCLTIIPRARVGYEMTDSQQDAEMTISPSGIKIKTRTLTISVGHGIIAHVS